MRSVVRVWLRGVNFLKKYKEKEMSNMATQIAPTPVVKGTVAVEIFKEANQKRSKASKNGAEKLKSKFSKKIK